MMTARVSIFCLLLAALTVAVPAASRAQQESIGTFRDWVAYTFVEGGNKACYIGSVPGKESGDYSRRGATYVTVTHRPAENRLGEVSVEAGYPYKEGSEVQLIIDGKPFRLFTQNRDGGNGDGNAWAYDDQTDKALVNAMKAGTTMVVKGTSSRGTETTDRYSLSGFTAAYNAIGKACGVR